MKCLYLLTSKFGEAINERLSLERLSTEQLWFWFQSCSRDAAGGKNEGRSITPPPPNGPAPLAEEESLLDVVEQTIWVCLQCGHQVTFSHSSINKKLQNLNQSYDQFFLTCSKLNSITSSHFKTSAANTAHTAVKCNSFEKNHFRAVTGIPKRSML